jgi:lysine/ornithine N-monooxygenase
MKTIYKQKLNRSWNKSYSFNISSINDIKSAINQREEICIYYVNDDKVNKRNVDIIILGTGHIVEDELFNDYKFIDTVSLQNGALIFHIFARIEK